MDALLAAVAAKEHFEVEDAAGVLVAAAGLEPEVAAALSRAYLAERPAPKPRVRPARVPVQRIARPARRQRPRGAARQEPGALGNLDHDDVELIEDDMEELQGGKPRQRGPFRHPQGKGKGPRPAAQGVKRSAAEDPSLVRKLANRARDMVRMFARDAKSGQD